MFGLCQPHCADNSACFLPWQHPRPRNFLGSIAISECGRRNAGRRALPAGWHTTDCKQALAALPVGMTTGLGQLCVDNMHKPCILTREASLPWWLAAVSRSNTRHQHQTPGTQINNLVSIGNKGGHLTGPVPLPHLFPRTLMKNMASRAAQGTRKD